MAPHRCRWIASGPEERAALVRSGPSSPGHASVNWHEDGADLVAGALRGMGLGIEAGAAPALR
ncbi:hypothetical protein LE181_11965 [Streptomyces sp. SCA3-4]|uniref:hypothetical protein n=1 Tax=Streptomyces sichuanensis TaxID=2871810 RepID=UPI001CE2AB3A|nr:hypothetical protein [Streptomyces sichuanensis]MCA6092870.1 hypothetical protein [Streptomyces sichuanensis]